MIEIEEIRIVFKDMYSKTNNLLRDPDNNEYYLYDDVQNKFQGFIASYILQQKKIEEVKKELSKAVEFLKEITESDYPYDIAHSALYKLKT